MIALCSFNLNGGQNEKNIISSTTTSIGYTKHEHHFLSQMSLISGLVSGKCPQITMKTVFVHNHAQIYSNIPVTLAHKMDFARMLHREARRAQWKLSHGKNEKLRGQKQGKCTSWLG